MKEIEITNPPSIQSSDNYSAEQALHQAAKDLAAKDVQTLEDLEEYSRIAHQVPVVDFSERARQDRLNNTERYQKVVLERKGRIAVRMEQSKSQ